MNKISSKMYEPIKGVMSGVIIGYAITFIVFITYAMLLTYSNVGESKLDMVVVITTLFAVMVAGFDAAKMAESRGLFWGVVAGLMYAVILIIIGFIVTDTLQLNGKDITTMLISMAGGGIGGIVGINFKK